MSEDFKRQVGDKAAELIEDGTRLGIGTGSTAEAFIHALAGRVQEGLSIVGVPTSLRTQALCGELGIALSTLEETPHLDLTVDGADEIGPGLALIKGAGGALMREKIVAQASDRMLVIADHTKVVETLGAFPLPIEVLSFGLTATHIAIEERAQSLGLSVSLSLREKEGKPYVTDNGNLILDASFGRIAAPEELARELAGIAGVVEHGLFIGLASKAIVAGPSGLDILTNEA